MLFIDRFDAALKLIPGLRNYRNENGIIYAIPGGGVPIGYYLAKDYNFPMHLLISKKIQHPKEKDLSIGAVGLHEQMVDERLNIPASYIRNQVTRIRKSLHERYSKMLGGQKNDVKGKMVFIVDDGIETGNTMLAAIRMVRAQNPKKIIVVTPVCSSSAAPKIIKEADDFHCLHILKNSIGLGINYLNFSSVTDK